MRYFTKFHDTTILKWEKAHQFKGDIRILCKKWIHY